MKVYILGLRDSFRGEHLITNLRRKGLDAEISYGIDGRNLTPSQLSKLSSNKRSRRIMRRELTPMEIGCALGHRKIYEQFLLSDYEWALILEEDCFITEDFVIDKVRLRKLEGPVIVNLQGVSRILSNYDRFPHLIYNVSNISESPTSFNTYSVKGNVQGAFAYLMNRNAAQIAIDSYGLIDSVADWPYAWRNKVHFSITDLAQFGVSLEGSLIAQGRSEKLSETNFEPGWLGSIRILNQLRTMFGLIGLASVLSLLKGYGYRQDYTERFAIPFLVRRSQRGKW